ncbi:reverse transcriptase domain-containing protein [Tanacetum coccineum]
MGIVVSMIHGAIKFHTEKGIIIVFSTDKADKGAKRARKIPATNKERILSCINSEEKIIVNDKYPDQTTHADMTKILRTIMVKGKPFNTKHKLNEYSHIKPIKQNKRGLGLDRNMKLNPNKCSFSVEEGPFLGYLITKHGIKANPSKVNAVTDLDQPRTLKDIQSLNKKLAALKSYKEPNSTTLPWKSLCWPWFMQQEGRYFQAHTIIVLINTTIKKILTGPEKTGRVAKRAIKLGEHDIVFLRREEKEMIADFLIEIPSEDNKKKEKPKEVPDSSSKWRLYTDGASNSDGSGAGLMLIDPKGKEYTYALRFEFETTNNEAEYKALLAGSCGFNAEPHSLVVKIMKQGFFWPSMHREVAKAMQDCEKCKEQSAIRKAGTSGAIAAGST